MEKKISVIQFDPALGNPTANIEFLERQLDAISDSSLVIMPELSNSGYNFLNKEEAFEFSETIGRRGLFQDFLLDQAAMKKIHIVSGINERDGKRLYNTAILAGPEGILGKYRKLHLFLNEKDIFQQGDQGLPVFDIGGWKIGMMICFDYLFPEPWRIMAQKGADLICHPSNLLTENAQRCVPAICLMNRIYIATANRTGSDRGITFNGNSFITSPEGKILRMASADKPEVLVSMVDLEKSRNKMVTARNHVFKDRRPDQYIL